MEGASATVGFISSTGNVRHAPLVQSMTTLTASVVLHAGSTSSLTSLLTNAPAYQGMLSLMDIVGNAM